MDTAPQPQPVRRSGGRTALKILAIVFVVLILVCGGIGTYVALKWRSLAVGAMRGPMLQMIDETGLPDDQKESIKANINRMADDFEAGKMTAKQFARIAEKLTQGPFFDLVIVEAVQAEQLPTLDLSDDERADAELTFDRFERALVEDKLTVGQVQEVMSIISTQSGGGQRQPKQDLTADDVKAFIEAMKAKADAVEIPTEPFQVDFAGQIQQAIDAVLGTGPDTTATTEPAA